MLRFDAWYLPDGETHMPWWMVTTNRREAGRLTYQYHKYAAALPHVRQWRTAVDVGAHVGLWAYWLARDFALVHAFEPAAAHRECFVRNVPLSPTVVLHPDALGAGPGETGLAPGIVCSGNAHLDPSAQARVPIAALDAFGVPDVDFLKIDTEGFEAFVVEGALATIAACRPVIVVEQKPGCGARYGRGDREAVDLLTGLGATVVGELSGDVILAWRDADAA